MKLPVWTFHLLVLFSFISSSYANLCSRGFSKEQRDSFYDLRCHCSESSGGKDDYEEIMTSDLDLRLKDESSAVVTFSFPPNPCVFQRYNIELNFVNLTSVVNGNCSNYHPENHTLEDDVTVSPLRHSMRKYYTSSNSSFGAQCPERPSIEFHHIFGGCYYVMITPYEGGLNEGHKKAVFSKPTFLGTSVSKADVELMNVTVKVNSEPKNIHNLTHITTRFLFNERSLARVPTIASVSLKFNIVDLHGESVCTRSGIEYDCCEIMNDANSTYVCNSDIGQRVTQCKLIQEEKFARVECIMPANFVGNYCVLLEIKDDRCPSIVGDVWSLGHDHHAQSCIWHHRGFAPYTLPPDGVVASSGSPDWYVWLILSLVIVGVLGFLFYYFYLLLRRGLLVEEPNDEEGGIEVLNTALPLLSRENKIILLLYARDCEKFMDLMSQFRDLLSETCKKEVVDIYNENYEQELNQQGIDFLLDLLKRNKTSGKDLTPEVTIVIVLTECGIAHHQAQLKGSRLEYKEQESLDAYFPLALKTLKEDSNTNMYNRVHMVEFTSFKVPAKSPEIFINALTRYKMPKHFKELVRALLRLNNKCEIDVCEDNLNLLDDKIDDLVSFKKEDPDYLVSLVSQVSSNGGTTQLSEK